MACIFQGSAAANVTHDASMGPRNHAPTSQLFRLTARDALRLLNSSLLPPCKYSMERNVQGDCLPWTPEAAPPFVLEALARWWRAAELEKNLTSRLVYLRPPWGLGDSLNGDRGLE